MAKRQTKGTKEVAAQESQQEILTPVTFRCRVCGNDKPIEEMKVLTKYFPPMVLCKDCEKTQ